MLIRIFICCFLFFTAYADEIIQVEAPRYENLYRDSAQGTIVIDQQQIQQSSAVNLADLLMNSSSLSVLGNGGESQNASAFLRGGKSEHVLVLVDGIEMNDPSNPTRSFNDFHAIPLQSIERIEIYQGAKGSSFGSNALSGVINIITKTSPRSEIDSSVAVSNSTYNTWKGHLTFGQNKEAYSYHLNVHADRSEGYSLADDPGTLRPDKDGHKNWGHKVNLLLKDMAGVKLSLTNFRYISRTQIDDFGADDPDRDLLSKREFYQSKLEKSFLNEQLKSSLSYQLNTTSRDQMDQSPTAFSPFHQSYRGKIQKVESRNHYDINKHHALLAGISWQEEKATDWVNKILGKKQSGHDIYGHHLYEGNLYFHEVGLRYSGFEHFSDHLSTSLLSGLRLLKGFTLSGSFSRGQKVPSLFQQYAFASAALKPEKAQNWEVATKYQHSLFALKVGYFNTQYTDLLEYSFSTSNYQNTDKVEISGVELALNLTPIKHLQIDSAWTYQDTYERSTAKRLLRRPNHKINNSVTYRWNHLNYSFSHQYIGHRDDINAQNFSREKVDSFHLYSTAIKYNLNEQFLTTFKLNNLFDDTSPQVSGYHPPGRTYLIELNWNTL